ncbi:MAG: hypothetical protein ACXWDO_05570 [Bacteroidia bacterium]
MEILKVKDRNYDQKKNICPLTVNIWQYFQRKTTIKITNRQPKAANYCSKSTNCQITKNF